MDTTTRDRQGAIPSQAADAIDVGRMHASTDTEGRCDYAIADDGRRHRRPPLREAGDFWQLVEKTSGCWIWRGGVRGPNGYGYVRFEGRPISAHRFVFELAYGPIPNGRPIRSAAATCVLHQCDNRICVRPDHLFLGTMGDNARDAVAKGRAVGARNLIRHRGDDHYSRRHPERLARGERNGKARHSDALIAEIRLAHAEGARQIDLQRRFDMNRTLVYKIVHGKTRVSAGGPVS